MGFWNMPNFADWRTWYGIGWFVFVVVFHEFGHYVIAKRQGIYKKIGIIPGLGFSVNLTQNYKRRIDYLSGLIFSFIAFPFFLLGIKFGAFGNAKWWVFIVFALALAIWDIVLFFFVGKQFTIKKRTKLTDLLAKLKIIAYGPEFEDVDQILKDIVANGGCVFRDNVTVIEKKIKKENK